MFRHSLDPLFQPQSLVIVSDNPLPVFQALPSDMKQRTTRIDAEPGEMPVFPSELNGVSDTDRLDLALVCMPPLMLSEVLAELEAYRPMALIVLAHEVIDPDPSRTRRCAINGREPTTVPCWGPFPLVCSVPTAA